AAFDNAFDTITISLYYSEKIVRFLWEKARLFSPEGERVTIECMEACKRSRKDFKDSVDDSFNAFEHFIVDLTNATGFFVDTLVECTDQPVTEDTDKSIQTEAVITEEAEIPDDLAKERTLEGAAGTKTVRKSVRRLKKIKNENQEEENGTEANRKADD
ncbi:MAG: hypothetical protein HGB33_09455, partial [Syntrophaceae bacterium]|nr:hypothetical protein [Syntrophaceae bacterium]